MTTKPPCHNCVVMEILDDFRRRLSKEGFELASECLEASIRTCTEPKPAPATKAEFRKRDTCYNTCAAVGCKTRIAYHPGEKPDKYCPKHQEEIDSRVQKARML